jgi:hypothetical protein
MVMILMTATVPARKVLSMSALQPLTFGRQNITFGMCKRIQQFEVRATYSLPVLSEAITSASVPTVGRKSGSSRGPLFFKLKYGYLALDSLPRQRS